MTEKNYNSQQKDSKTMQKQSKAEKAKSDIPKEETKKENAEKKDEKKQKTEHKHVKKDEAVINGISLPISTLDAMFIGKFIRRKTISKAIEDLGEVMKFKRAIPMTGEIPHRKGKGMMSGRYPIKPIGYFINLLKTLRANASVNGLEEPIIAEVISNKASQPYGSGGRKRKRTHVKIRVIEKSKLGAKK